MSDTSGIEPRTPEETSGLTSVAADAPLTGNGTAGSHLGISAATTGAAGSMSAADKAKLDGITAGATNTPLSSATPQQLGSAAAGSSTSAARDDHVHAHGNQSGGSLHSAVVAAGAAGFMSGSDKSKLDGVAASATNTPLASTMPANVGTAAVGVGTTAARDDHVHALPATGTAGTYANPSSITTDAQGRVISATAGSAPVALSSTTPAAVGTAAVGVGTTAARDDHVHAHGNQAGGTLHANAVAAGAAGFMTGADKTKLDALPSALSLPVSAANGGTGASTLPVHAVLLGNGTSPVGSAAPSTSGQVLTSTGASGDPAFADTVTASNSASMLASTFSITAANGTYAGTGLTVTLPSAGTYLVLGNIRSTVAVSAGAGANISFRLRDTTAGSDVSTSTRIGAYASTTGAAYITTTPIAELIAVASSHVIELYAASNTGTTYTARSIDSDTAGYTKLWFIKVSP